jgi:hypothetical protein
MEKMRIKKLKLALIVAVVADIIALIFEYPIIYIVVFTQGWSTFNIIEVVSELIH